MASSLASSLYEVLGNKTDARYLNVPIYINISGISSIAISVGCKIINYPDVTFVLHIWQ